MTRRAALPAGFARLVDRPFVRGPFFVSRPAALAGDLALFDLIHCREAAMLFFHVLSTPSAQRKLAPLEE